MEDVTGHADFQGCGIWLGWTGMDGMTGNSSFESMTTTIGNHHYHYHVRYNRTMKVVVGG